MVPRKIMLAGSGTATLAIVNPLSISPAPLNPKIILSESDTVAPTKVGLGKFIVDANELPAGELACVYVPVLPISPVAGMAFAGPAYPINAAVEPLGVLPVKVADRSEE